MGFRPNIRYCHSSSPMKNASILWIQIQQLQRLWLTKHATMKRKLSQKPPKIHGSSRRSIQVCICPQKKQCPTSLKSGFKTPMVNGKLFQPFSWPNHPAFQRSISIAIDSCSPQNRSHCPSFCKAKRFCFTADLWQFHLALGRHQQSRTAPVAPEATPTLLWTKPWVNPSSLLKLRTWGMHLPWSTPLIT